MSSSLLAGAFEKGTTRGAFDFQEPYLLRILALIGLTGVTFIHAENQARKEADVFSQPLQNVSAESSMIKTNK